MTDPEKAAPEAAAQPEAVPAQSRRQMEDGRNTRQVSSLAELNARARASAAGVRPKSGAQELEELRRQKQALGQELAAARQEAKEAIASARRESESIVAAANAEARRVRMSANAEADAIVGAAVAEKAANDGRQLPAKAKTAPATDRAEV